MQATLKHYISVNVWGGEGCFKYKSGYIPEIQQLLMKVKTKTFKETF